MRLFFLRDPVVRADDVGHLLLLPWDQRRVYELVAVQLPRIRPQLRKPHRTGQHGLIPIITFAIIVISFGAGNVQGVNDQMFILSNRVEHLFIF